MTIVKAGDRPVEIEGLRRGSRKHLTVPFDDMQSISETDTGVCIKRVSGGFDHVLCTPAEYEELKQARHEFIKMEAEAGA